ncbi:glutaredoxin domain-containing protein [Nocardia seriolae]|uniref:Mycoredoxin n=1 Tax=Nocardia seriolae TaxID=37332 RepID=A0A0B8N7Q5_9NOCA|nr:glutaredoxin domain-containing protein [Nocardia seriolae]APA95894.1 Mycoredoxin [Nocardia seriolae]MTJ66005.1 NrdH-redoxin [Nocardia seriolae]MTJ75796.1 NrdH-redoxin [Nocardia seriolae]MTJ86071.1 NrdH-redoxin [Nocardia seriolae]MTK30066.1 NrdH-redoxin [Nocardia seriolae]
MTADIPELVVYRRPGCPYCARLRNALNRHGIVHREVDIWEDPDAAAFVRSVANGNETVPTVVLRDGSAERNWVNPPPKELIETVRSDAPALTGGPRRFFTF